MPPALDPGLPGAIIVIVALVSAAALIWLADRRRGRRGRPGAVHGMAREESVSYFRDFGSAADGARARKSRARLD